MSTKDRLIKRLQDGGFKAIIFDFDGTLVDISEALHKSVEEVFEYYKIEADVDKTIVEIAALLETMQGYPLPKIILQSYDMFKYITTLESLSFLKKLRVAAKMFSKFLTYAEDAPLFPNTIKLIKKLKKSSDLYIVSHNQTKNIIDRLEIEGIVDYFKGIYGADLLPELKPSPNSLLPVFENYKTSRVDDFVMIGDMPSDIEAGQEAGIWTIAIASGVSNKEVLNNTGANLIVDSLNNLLELIEKK